MRRITHALLRPRRLPEITVAIVWAPHEEIESLVNATETLAIKRRTPGLTYTPTSTTNATATSSTAQTDGNQAEPIAEKPQQGQIYYIQTKILGRSINYVSLVRLIVLPPRLQFIADEVQDLAPGVRALITRATTIAMPITPVLPPGLLQKITITENSTMSARQSLAHVLAGVDQFADWESSAGELLLWWLMLLRPYWCWIGFVLVFLPLLILVIVLP
ncbi:hypothetical protein N7519_007765 [Penicillium mononematosum]|uniref:uncharacterized protein n=1 Tax=Penicillium mononematosum TaxID=268346 RepID=UPI002546B9B8|nr:uncharacterized protein N7519_007765 [Penicillium mononematosum]KAJ6186464.1 hypothetical protein N7519_007765 [Penicillium mononematosum]